MACRPLSSSCTFWRFVLDRIAWQMLRRSMGLGAWLWMSFCCTNIVQVWWEVTLFLWMDIGGLHVDIGTHAKSPHWIKKAELGFVFCSFRKHLHNSGDIVPTFGSAISDRLACGIPSQPPYYTWWLCMARAAMLVLCLAFQGVNSQMPLEAKRFQEAPTG